MSIYINYLIKRSLVITGFVFGLFIFVDFLFNLIGEFEDLSLTYTFIKAFNFSLLSIPDRAYAFIEGSCLLGFMIAMGLSQEEGNLNVLRSSGISPLKIVLLTSIGPLSIAFFFMFGSEFIFKDIGNKAVINKTIMTSSINNAQEESVWLIDGNKFLNFERKIGDQIFGVQYFELQDNKINLALSSLSAEIKNSEINFDNSTSLTINKNLSSTSNNKSLIKDFNFPIIISKSLRDIETLTMRESYNLNQLLSGDIGKQDRIFKAHIEKKFYKFLFMPISIIILILFFGYFIFGSLRDSSPGSKIVISVLGAFVYQIIQDLTISIAISFNMFLLIGVCLPAFILLMSSFIMYRRLN